MKKLALLSLCIPVADAADGTLSLRLNAYAFESTSWKPQEVREATQAAARLLEQCGVVLEPLELRVIDVPERFRYYSTAVSRELLRDLHPPKPAIFFVEDTRNTPAFDAETIGRANARNRPELADTIWVAHGARDLPLALAHELVHLVSDSGEHSSEPGNLMRAETSPSHVRLTRTQCDRLRANGVAHGLLAPR